MAQIDELFREMKERGASDLHMVIGFPPLLRMRGDLVPTQHPVLTPESNRDFLYEILSAAQQSHLEKNRDLDLAYEVAQLARFRCNFLHQQRGLGAVFRIIPTDIMTVEQLGLPAVVKDIAMLKQGLVLVTGPT
jgi:twitching motility protein PilT